MADLPAVRRLGRSLANDNVDLLLVNIHEPTGETLSTRYDFEYSPTYILFDADGSEIWRSNRRPDEETILAALTSGVMVRWPQTARNPVACKSRMRFSCAS